MDEAHYVALSGPLQLWLLSLLLHSHPELLWNMVGVGSVHQFSVCLFLSFYTPPAAARSAAIKVGINYLLARSTCWINLTKSNKICPGMFSILTKNAFY